MKLIIDSPKKRDIIAQALHEKARGDREAANQISTDLFRAFSADPPLDGASDYACGQRRLARQLMEQADFSFELAEQVENLDE